MLALLGPQRFRPTLRDAVTALGVAGPVAVVTAGWQEREGEHTELGQHLGQEVVDLRLYHRAEDVNRRDPELAGALRARQELLRELQELYRLRLGPTLEAARALLSRAGDGRWLEAARREAIRAVQVLDRAHLRDLHELHAEFAAEWRPERRPVVVEHRAELARLVERTGALCIAGGHVAVLLGRLRLFDIVSLVGDRPVFAWSAGAMAACERVVVYHDNPPQGAGHAEVLDAGLGLCRRLVALPHARRRLKLDDPARVALFARRFAPSNCVAFDDGARLVQAAAGWRSGPGTFRLEPTGSLRALG